MVAVDLEAPVKIAALFRVKTYPALSEAAIEVHRKNNGDDDEGTCRAQCVPMVTVQEHCMNRSVRSAQGDEMCWNHTGAICIFLVQTEL